MPDEEKKILGYEITVGAKFVGDEQYGHKTIFKQNVDELDMKALIKVVNGIA